MPYVHQCAANAAKLFPYISVICLSNNYNVKTVFLEDAVLINK
jgi:hypothetical protein